MISEPVSHIKYQKFVSNHKSFTLGCKKANVFMNSGDWLCAISTISWSRNLVFWVKMLCWWDLDKVFRSWRLHLHQGLQCIFQSWVGPIKITYYNWESKDLFPSLLNVFWHTWPSYKQLLCLSCWGTNLWAFSRLLKYATSTSQPQNHEPNTSFVFNKVLRLWVLF